MGVNQLVMPLDPPMLDWADKCGVPVQGVIANGRLPALDELIEAVSTIPGHSFKMGRRGDSFDIKVESEQTITFPCEGVFRNTIAPGLAVGPATYTDIHGSARSTGVIEWMSFHGHMELLVAIVRRLTSSCGPQVFLADCDGIPWLVLSADAVPIAPEPWHLNLPDF